MSFDLPTIILAEHLPAAEHAAFIAGGAIGVYDLAYCSIENLASFLSAHLDALAEPKAESFPLASTPANIEPLPEHIHAIPQVHNQADLLSQAVEHLSIGVYLTDETRDSRITIWNRLMEKLFRRPKNQVIGRSIYEVFDDPVVRSILTEVSNPHSKNRAILPKYRNDGHRESNFIADVSKTILANDSGQTLAVIGVVHDVTDRIQSENRLVAAFNELEASKEKLEQSNLEIRRGIEKAKKLAVAAQSSNKAKSFLLSNISHELRTPLNSIVSLTHALMEGTFGPLNRKQAENLEIVADSARHLQALIIDILDLSKIELGKMTLKISKTNVSEIAQSSIRMVEQQAASKNVRCVLRLEHQTELIDADAKRLRQILLNLLVNAVKFTRSDSEVILTVSENLPASSIVFSVSDHGIGIPEGDFHRIFSPFTQLDDSLSRQYEGTGLGLAIVAKFVELHGGGLSVESALNAGATFTIELPKSIDESLSLEPVPTLAEIALSPKRTRNLVLVIDENERVAHSIRQSAISFSSLAPIVTTPGEISAYCDQLRPLAVIVDLATITTHGYDWIQRARELPAWKKTRWIATSSLDVKASRETAKKQKFDEFRCKPIAADTFETLVTKSTL